MNNPFANVKRVELTTDEVTAKTITYTYESDKEGVAPIVMVREPNTKGRPKVSLNENNDVYFLVKIETKYPKEVEMAKKVAKKVAAPKKEKVEKVPFKEEVIAVSTQEEVKTTLEYTHPESKLVTQKTAGRGRPLPRLEDGSILSRRIKYVLQKPEKAEKVKKVKVFKEKTPVVEQFDNTDKPYSIFVYSDGQRIDTRTRGKGAPRKVLDNGATLEKIIKVKPAPKRKRTTTTVNAVLDILEEAQEAQLPDGEFVTLTDLDEGERFYRLRSLDGSVDYDLGILEITDIDPEYVKYKFAPKIIAGSLMTENTVRGQFLTQKVYRLSN